MGYCTLAVCLYFEPDLLLNDKSLYFALVHECHTCVGMITGGTIFVPNGAVNAIPRP